MKQVRAFLFSPIPAAVLGALVSWASGGFPRPLSIAILYLLLLYAAQLVFGLAVRAYLLKTNRHSGISYMLGGMVMTGIPSVLYLTWAAAQNLSPLGIAAFVLVLWLILGGLTGFTYWRLTSSPEKAPVTT